MKHGRRHIGQEYPLDDMMYIDSQNYLPNDILTKVDRASMYSGLEVRSPFLDHRVATLASQMPLSMMIRRENGINTGKWCLRQILYKYVPKNLIDRPKTGFGVPMSSWLRGPLRSWAESLLDPELILHQGFLYPSPIRTLWKQHLSGQYDHSQALWNILVWQSWLLNNKPNTSQLSGKL